MTTDVVTSTAPVANAATFGTQGPVGPASYTTTTLDFVQPASGSSVSVTMGSNAWFAVGQTVYVATGGSYVVASKTSTTVASLTNTTGATGNAAPATTIASGSIISAGGVQGAAGASGAAGTNPGVTTADTTQVPSTGLFVCSPYPGCVEPTDNWTAQRSQCRGVCTVAGSVSGSVTSSGNVTVKLSTEGGAPQVDGLIWLEAALADSNTAAGKGTATKPSAGVQLISRPQFAGMPNKNPVAVGRVVTEDWVATKTAVVSLLTPCGPVPPQVSDVTWDSTKYSGFSAANNLSVIGSTTNAGLADGESIHVLVTIDGIFTGEFSFLANFNTGATRGFQFAGGGGTIQFFLFGAAGAVGVLSFVQTSLRSGDNHFVVTNNGGFLTGALNGTPSTPVASGAFVAPDATCTLVLGNRPVYDWPWPWGLYSVVKVGRALSAQEQVRLTREQTRPSPPRDPYHFADEILLDPAVQWYWHTEFVTGVQGPLGAGLGWSFTANGTITSTDVGTTWYRNLGNYMLDTGPVAVDALGQPIGLSMYCVEFEATAKTVRLGATWSCNSPGDWDDSSAAWFRGTAGQAANTFIDMVPPIGGSPALPFPDGVERTQYSPIHTAFVAPAARSIRFTGGSRCALFDSLGSAGIYKSWAKQGLQLTGIVAERGLTFKTQTTAPCTKRIVVVGDDSEVGKAIGATGSAQSCVVTKMRADYAGRVSNYSTVIGSLTDLYVSGGNSMVPAARQVVNLGLETPGATVVVLIALGWRDYQVPFCTAAQFGTRLAAFADAIHALQPTWTVLAEWPTEEHFFTVPNTTNSETLNQFIAQITTVVSTRTVWMTAAPINASVPTAITYTDGTFTAEDVAGALAKKNNRKAALTALGLY